VFVDLIRGIREEKKALKTISLTLSVGLGSRSLFQHHFLFLINEYIQEKKKKNVNKRPKRKWPISALFKNLSGNRGDG
jgi:hypothetical protein